MLFFRRDYAELARGRGPTPREGALAIGVGCAVYLLRVLLTVLAGVWCFWWRAVSAGPAFTARRARGQP